MRCSPPDEKNTTIPSSSFSFSFLDSHPFCISPFFVAPHQVRNINIYTQSHTRPPFGHLTRTSVEELWSSLTFFCSIIQPQGFDKASNTLQNTSLSILLSKFAHKQLFYWVGFSCLLNDGKSLRESESEHFNNSQGKLPDIAFISSRHQLQMLNLKQQRAQFHIFAASSSQ